MKGRNTTLLVKLNWRFYTEEDALWMRVLKRKYCSNKRLNAVNMDRLPCSQIWRAIKKGRETFNEGSMWVVHRGSTLSFWLDNWTCKGPIRSLIHGPLMKQANGRLKMFWLMEVGIGIEFPLSLLRKLNQLSKPFLFP